MVLDLVPFARAGREVANSDGEPGSVREPLQLPFPEPHAGSIAAAGVRRDEERSRSGIGGLSHDLPPTSMAFTAKAAVS